MTKNQHHVTYKNNQWQGKKTGADRAAVVGKTKQEVVDKTREISKNQKTEFVIHNQDGKIAQKDSHQKDNYPPKG